MQFKKDSDIIVGVKGGKIFQKVPGRNAGFTLPGGLSAISKCIKKTSRKTLKNLLILAGLIPFLFTKPVIAQVRTAVPKTSVVPTATQTTTDEATQKRIKELIAQLGYKNWRVRETAARALGKIGDPQAVLPLIRALSDRNVRVRKSAALALGEIGDVKANQPLIIKALEDEDAGVRQAAAQALGKIGDPQAVRALRKRALARKAREVPLTVIKLLVLCALVSLLIVGLFRLMKSQRQSIIRLRRYMQHKIEAGDRATRAIFIYLAIVFVNAICPLQFVLLGFSPFCGLLGLLGFHWLIITTGGFLVLVHEYDLGGADGGLGLFYLLSLAYSAVFFLPLFGALCFKEKTDKNRFKVVQVIFIICHVAVIFILISLYDLGNRMVDIIRY